MTVKRPEDLHDGIARVVPNFLNMARGLCWNTISDRCLFIISEIRNSTENAHMQREQITKENKGKIPLPLESITAVLEQLFHELYDINIYIHRAKKELTIIDIRYYLKSSLDPDYRKTVNANPPMLHCNVTTPPWLSDERQKFDINWERKTWLNRWRIFWARFWGYLQSVEPGEIRHTSVKPIE